MNSDAITTSTDTGSVLLCSELEPGCLQNLLSPYGLAVHTVADNENIPGSFWKDSEAGLIENRLYLREDTPVHSALHEACHYICMDRQRREQLHTNAGGGYEEEDAVCYLQILLAEKIPGMQAARMFSDMDAWGYSFRLGSAQAWFENDADDALEWLSGRGLVTRNGRPAFTIRSEGQPAPVPGQGRRGQ
jgi:hypothetical protein